MIRTILAQMSAPLGNIDTSSPLPNPHLSLLIFRYTTKRPGQQSASYVQGLFGRA